jgi:hypothetical protein
MLSRRCKCHRAQRKRDVETSKGQTFDVLAFDIGRRGQVELRESTLACVEHDAKLVPVVVCRLWKRQGVWV